MTFHRRNISGMLLLDKPRYISSNKISQKIRKMYKASRVGHVGTLDPIATGILPICFGQTTKFSQYLSNSNKSYHVTALLGEKTTTADCEGDIISRRPLNFSSEQLTHTLENFKGTIKQVPPMYSAIKYRGKSLYKYAIQGIEVVRKPRVVTIHKLVFIQHKDKNLELEIHCSKGTYIRSLIDDLGESLGCGAHITSLRRLQVGSYVSKDMVSVEKIFFLHKKCIEEKIPTEKLLDSLLKPIDSPVCHLPSLNFPEIYIQKITKGQPIPYYGTLKDNNMIRIKSEHTKFFVGIGRVKKNNIFPVRMLSTIL